MRETDQRPVIGVGVVVLKDGRVLLVRRGKAPRAGRWSLPGGRQEFGETVRETALREVREETGLEVEITALLDVVDSLTRDEAGRLSHHYTLIDFLAEWRAGDAVAGSDAAAVAWADPRELDGFTLWEETARLIRLAIDRHRVKGRGGGGPV